MLGTLKCHYKNLDDIKVIYPSLWLINIQKWHDYDHLGATMINQDPKILSHESWSLALTLKFIVNVEINKSDVMSDVFQTQFLALNLVQFLVLFRTHFGRLLWALYGMLLWTIIGTLIGMLFLMLIVMLIGTINWDANYRPKRHQLLNWDATWDKNLDAN